MVVLSIRMKHLKMAAFFALLAVIAALLVLAVVASRGSGNGNFSTSAQRMSFLGERGIAATNEVVDSVIIPTEWNAAYSAYNALQQAQGLSLSRYKGREVERYSYNDGAVTLLIYEGKVIGYDIYNE